MYLFPVVQFNIGYAFTILRSIASMESSSATVLLELAMIIDYIYDRRKWY